MAEDELLRFNLLIAKAFTQFESENEGRTTGVMRGIVVASLKTGAAPEKIYATIKTGQHEIDETAMTLRLWVRRKRGNRFYA